MPALCLIAVLFISACNLPHETVPAATATALAARQTLYAASYPSATPADNTLPTLIKPISDIGPDQPISPLETLSPQQPTMRPLPTTAITVPAGQLLYYSQSGDTLAVIAKHFLVKPEDLTHPTSYGANDLLPVGTPVLAPNRFSIIPAYDTPALPDSEVIFSPGCNAVDLEALVRKAGGFLSGYQEYFDGKPLSGAGIIAMIARETSTNPRLLLAILEYRSGWVYGQPSNVDSLKYPIGYKAPGVTGLIGELHVTARILAQGYYGWRGENLQTLTFKDESVAQIHPWLNPGSVAIQNLWAVLYTQQEFYEQLYGTNGFLSFYNNMFGNAWERSARIGSLLTETVTPPSLSLPFLPGMTWALTSGPHYTWQTGTPRGALDFAALTGQKGCLTSSAWATASAPGLVVRSENGSVVIDLDGDGDESTGWALVYLHLAQEGRIKQGTWVNRDDMLGHPSCEGGIATGAHVHIARKYNGEWIAAEGPLPLWMDGWQAFAARSIYDGWLIREGQIITAYRDGRSAAQITRDR